MRINFTLFVFLLSFSLFAQDDLDALLDDMDSSEEEQKVEYVRYAFKSIRVINLQSLEKVAGGTMEFRISHRFNHVKNHVFDLFGLDDADIRFSFDYGINDWVTVGFGRSQNGGQPVYDFYTKASILRQSTGKRKMPLSILYYGSIAVNASRDQSDGLFAGEPGRRFTYTNQLIIGSKITDWLSLQLSPTVVHRNQVRFTTESNTIFAVGVAGRLKLTKRLAITGEYVPRMIDYGGDEASSDARFVNSAGIGLDIETGGHVFQFHFSNSQGMFERAYITETADKWLKGEIRFGFNITRQFTLNKKQMKPH